MLLRRILESAVRCTKNLPKKEMDCPLKKWIPSVSRKSWFGAINCRVIVIKFQWFHFSFLTLKPICAKESYIDISCWYADSLSHLVVHQVLQGVGEALSSRSCPKVRLQYKWGYPYGLFDGLKWCWCKAWTGDEINMLGMRGCRFWSLMAHMIERLQACLLQILCVLSVMLWTESIVMILAWLWITRWVVPEQTPFLGCTCESLAASN
jgi:hypothetical protein